MIGIESLSDLAHFHDISLILAHNKEPQDFYTHQV